MSAPRAELTVRGIIIGVAITLVFTAANVYFGLKAGLTFATSIPAAVISMALLRGFGDASAQENNIVQTIASSAGTLSAVIFVLPGLIMIGWWTGFPYWQSAAICALGGILGVMYTIPLRRALVTNSTLPYPEGVACAEVLRVGAGNEEADTGAVGGARAVLVGALVSAAYALLVQTRLFAGNVAEYFHIGHRGSASGYEFSLSFALFAVGHLVGLWVGIAMLVGALVGWGWAVPHYSLLHPLAGTAEHAALAAWSSKVRFLGAGTIGVAAIWTLVRLVRSVIGGLAQAMTAARVRRAGQAATLPRSERDMPIGVVGLITLLCMPPIAGLLWYFAGSGGLAAQLWTLVVGGVIFVLLISFFVAAVCGYMAGLIGSSNSPLSGVGILVVVIAAVLLALGVQPLLPASSGKALVAFALFVTALVFAVATIANDNLQDLKTGQLVDATPWKQQVALLIGVIAGALVIPPVLDLLNHAYGFAGAPGVDPARALPAPQAGLISALAEGVIRNNIDWSLIAVGGGIGALAIVLDELLGVVNKRVRLPPLAVGLGIYLPTSVTLMVAVGAVAGWLFDRRAERGPQPQATRQRGVLLASGMIVGESLIGVLIAAVVVGSGRAAPLALVGVGFADAARWLGVAAFTIGIALLYRWVSRRAGLTGVS